MLKELLQKNASSFISLFLLVVVPVLVSSTLAFYLYQFQSVLEGLTFIEKFFYFVVVSLTMAFALTPTTFVALVTGYYLGWPGFFGVVISYGIASLLGYTVARIMDQGKLLNFLHRFKKAGAVIDELREQSWSLIILSRISPVLPFAFMTFVLSLLRVEVRKFLMASMLGMLPRTLFFFWVGTQAKDILSLLKDPNTGNQGKLLLISLIVISLFGLYYIFNKALKRALRRTHQKKF